MKFYALCLFLFYFSFIFCRNLSVPIDVGSPNLSSHVENISTILFKEFFRTKCLNEIDQHRRRTVKYIYSFDTIETLTENQPCRLSFLMISIDFDRMCFVTSIEVVYPSLDVWCIRVYSIAMQLWIYLIIHSKTICRVYSCVWNEPFWSFVLTKTDLVRMLASYLLILFVRNDNSIFIPCQ
jgi:hypothetical protein